MTRRRKPDDPAQSAAFVKMAKQLAEEQAGGVPFERVFDVVAPYKEKAARERPRSLTPSPGSAKIVKTTKG